MSSKNYREILLGISTWFLWFAKSCGYVSRDWCKGIDWL